MPDFTPKSYSTGDTFRGEDETEVERELEEQEDYDVTQDAALAVVSARAQMYPADGYEDYRLEPTGAAPTKATTGQSTVTARTGVGSGNVSKIVGAKLVAAPETVNGTTYASYNQTLFDTDLIAAGNRWTVNSSDGATVDYINYPGAAALIIWNGVWNFTGSPPRSPAHITFSLTPGPGGRCNWTWFVSDGVSRLDAVKSGSFTAPALDATTLWEANVRFDLDNGVAILELPGIDAVTNSRWVTLTSTEIQAWYTANAPGANAVGGHTWTLTDYCAGANTIVVEHIKGTGITAAETRYPSYVDWWVGRSKRARESWLRGFVKAFTNAMSYVGTVLTGPRIDKILDVNGNNMVLFGAVANAVNYTLLNNGAAGGGPSLQAVGTNTNIGWSVVSKGAGAANFSNGGGGDPLKAGGVTVATRLFATAALNFGSVAAQSFLDLTITVTGAAVGDVVSLGVPTAAVTAGIVYSAWVSAADTVTVRAHNYTSGALDPASGTFKAMILK